MLNKLAYFWPCNFEQINMVVLYWLGIRLYSWLLALVAVSNEKARRLVQGQRQAFGKLAHVFGQNTAPVAWFHCASLGEFEQGRPVLEAFRADFPAHKILVTFFSSSGYESQKGFAGADLVCYLPTDTLANARRLLDLVRPSIVFFVKYEFWHYYTLEIARRKIPLICFSAVFRADQIYFKPWGGFFKQILRRFDCFFVQNEASLHLLKRIGLHQVVIGGDTRADRVQAIGLQPTPFPLVRRFKGDQLLLVLGSTWPNDIAVVGPVLNEWPQGLKLIIAPHELDPAKLRATEKAFANKKIIRYSQADETTDMAQYDVLLVDCVGILSQLYQYGDIAFVGGGLRQGLHNILEAAVFGIPVIFGNINYEKAEEAIALRSLGAAFTVADSPEFATVFSRLVHDPGQRSEAGQASAAYVRDQTGATKRLVDHCHTLIAQ